MTKALGREHEPMRLDAGKLGRLEFVWAGDRYRHAWYPSGQDSPALASIESNADAVWPVSPPLQQVHLQSFDDGREVIFGVGMSGRGHWSASFTMVPELHSWIVEFACRSPLVPERLGSAYQLNGAWEPSGSVWKRQDAASVVTIEAISPSHFLTSPEMQVSLEPAHLPSATPSTTQWAYRLKISA